MKPSDPDYIAALKREGIPVYTPTDQELRPWLHKPSPDLELRERTSVLGTKLEVGLGTQALSTPDSGSQRTMDRGCMTPISKSDSRIALPESAPVFNSAPFEVSAVKSVSPPVENPQETQLSEAQPSSDVPNANPQSDAQSLDDQTRIHSSADPFTI